MIENLYNKIIPIFEKLTLQSIDTGEANDKPNKAKDCFNIIIDQKMFEINKNQLIRIYNQVLHTKFI